MTVVSDVPTRPDGLQLIGEMEGSGYRVPPSLVRRGDGQTLQVTPLLYAVLEAVDGTRGYDGVAEAVRERTGKPVSADNVQQLVDSQLRPLGLLLKADGSAPELKRSNPLLGLRAKVSVTDPERTQRITDPSGRSSRRSVDPADGGLPGHLLVAAARQGAGVGDVRSLPEAGPAAARRRGHRVLGGFPRVRARGCRTSRRRHSRG